MIRACKWSLVHMLSEIAGHNSIEEYSFVTYRSTRQTDSEAVKDIIKKEKPYKLVFVKANRVISNGLWNIIPGPWGGQNARAIGIASRVHISEPSGDSKSIERYLFQLEFDFSDEQHYGVGKAVNDLAENALKLYERPGYVVKSSDNGYHFYGLEVISEEAWLELMRYTFQHSKEFMVHPKWLEIQLARGYSILRGSSYLYNKTRPRVVAKVLT